ncbi:MAG TPA: hypothetical protein GX706_03595 [Candidatus Moranbacteria bacterium]|nr:hypothetical protein [Candidatus Moranbacteria bacterium]
MKQKLNLEQADEQIKAYLETLLIKKGMDDLPPEIMANMLVDLFSRFNDLLLLNVFKAIPEEKQADLDELLSGEPTEDEMDEFFRKNINNYDGVIAETMKEFERVFLGSNIER